MKKIITVLGCLFIMPAMAEVAPPSWDGDIEYMDSDIIESAIVESVPVDTVPASTSPELKPGATTGANARATIGRGATTRGIPTTATATGRNTPSRAVASRNTVAANQVPGSASTTRRGGDLNVPGIATRRSSDDTINSARAGSIIQTDTVGTPLYTGRVGVRTTSASAIGVRAPTTRIATATNSASSSAPSVAEITQITDLCKTQYTQCMDNFCNVLDDNQGRCSCSANLKNYSKTETALKTATEELQNVAQSIQYIGLTKDEVKTLFSATVAELEMQKNTDSSRLQADLDKVKNMIIDVKTVSATSGDTGTDTDLSGLLDLSFSGSGFDLNSLFSGTSSTSSISNQRGTELHKTATARCKSSVLTSCAAQGVDVSIITNSYDLEIDKQCLVYERSLDDANSNMTSTVRNAKSVLQKARLLVAQQKNSYDLRGCVNALDSCMQDEFVCGGDYENCLDPSGKYIVNGSVVVGSAPGVSGGTLTSDKFANGIYTSWNYSATNAWSGTTGNISTFIDTELTSGTNAPPTSTTNMVDYLQQKIGYVDQNGKSLGMCVSILNKCQNHTYVGTNGTFDGKNGVVKNYLERTLIQIKTAQDAALAKYAENCITDVASCLSTNNYDAANPSKAATATNACKAVIATCASTTGNSELNIITSAGTAN